MQVASYLDDHSRSHAARSSTRLRADAENAGLTRPGLLWNGGPACHGIPARHHVESWPGMLWNLQGYLERAM